MHVIDYIKITKIIKFVLFVFRISSDIFFTPVLPLNCVFDKALQSLIKNWDLKNLFLFFRKKLTWTINVSLIVSNSLRSTPCEWFLMMNELLSAWLSYTLLNLLHYFSLRPAMQLSSLKGSSESEFRVQSTKWSFENEHLILLPLVFYCTCHSDHRSLLSTLLNHHNVAKHAGQIRWLSE